LSDSSTFMAYLDAHPRSAELLDLLRQVIRELGPAEETISKSQVAFQRTRDVALVWAPGQYLGERGAPLVLTLGFPEQDPSPRWKEIVEPRRGWFVHHLELHAADDIDDQVKTWIRRAYDHAA